MKHIIGAFSTLTILVLNLFLCIAVLTVSGDVAAAREYKAAVVAELENSNFNPDVVESCRKQAAACGYSLVVTKCIYDENQDVCSAEVILTYTYEIPLLGISHTRVTRGIAR